MRGTKTIYVVIVPGILQVAWLADSIKTRITMHCGIPGYDIYDKPVGWSKWENNIHILWTDLGGQKHRANHLVPLIKVRDNGKYIIMCDKWCNDKIDSFKLLA